MLLNPSRKLPIFLNKLMISSEIIYTTINQKLPIFQFSELSKMLIADFIKATNASSSAGVSSSADVSLSADPVEIKSCLIPLGFERGSNKVNELLEAIVESKNLSIFKTSLIQHFIQFHWNQHKPLITIYTMLLFCNLVSLLLLIHYKFETIAGLILFAIINFLLITWEIFQMIGTGFNYFKESLNNIDIFRSFLTIVWVILGCSGIEWLPLTWIVGVINLIRGVTGFVVFDGTSNF